MKVALGKQTPFYRMTALMTICNTKILPACRAIFANIKIRQSTCKLDLATSRRNNTLLNAGHLPSEFEVAEVYERPVLMSLSIPS